MIQTQISQNDMENIIKYFFNKTILEENPLSKQSLNSIKPEYITQEDLRNAFIKKDYYGYYKLGYEKYLKTSEVISSNKIKNSLLSFLDTLTSNPKKEVQKENLPFIDILSLFDDLTCIRISICFFNDWYYMSPVYKKIVDNIVKEAKDKIKGEVADYNDIEVDLYLKNKKDEGFRYFLDPDKSFESFSDMLQNYIKSRNYKLFLSYFFDGNYIFNKIFAYAFDRENE